MKTLKFKHIFKIMLFTLIIVGCTEEEDDLFGDQDGGNQIMFWSDFNGPPINVYVNGDFRGSITSVNTSAPDCGNSGSVTVNVSPGSLSYTAEETSSPFRTWSGSTNVSAECHRINLTN